jgi:mono/diheme cytochrome c family protein
MKRISKKVLQAFALAALCLAPGASFAASPEAGKALFEANCQVCHGPNGDGNGRAADDFILKPRDFALAAFKLDTDADWQRGTDADLANVIRNGPGAYGGSTAMQAWPDLTRQDIASLIAYIRSLES